MQTLELAPDFTYRLRTMGRHEYPVSHRRVVVDVVASIATLLALGRL